MPVSLLTGMVSQNYAPDGIDVKDPLYSPIYADYDEFFPPTVITVGTRDFALSHGIRFYWKLREAGVNVELLVSEGMWHGFNWDPVMPESIKARAAVIKFLKYPQENFKNAPILSESLNLGKYSQSRGIDLVHSWQSNLNFDRMIKLAFSFTISD